MFCYHQNWLSSFIVNQWISPCFLLRSQIDSVSPIQLYIHHESNKWTETYLGIAPYIPERKEHILILDSHFIPMNWLVNIQFLSFQRRGTHNIQASDRPRWPRRPRRPRWDKHGGPRGCISRRMFPWEGFSLHDIDWYCMILIPEFPGMTRILRTMKTFDIDL